jgi:hypothetical protein
MDSKLILQAQLRAGSRIHDVKGLMNAYGLWDGLAVRGDAAASVVVGDIECALRRFIATGMIQHVYSLLPPQQYVPERSPQSRGRGRINAAVPEPR